MSYPLIVSLLILLFSGGVVFPESKEFERIPMKSATLSLFQDERGFVWAGTGSTLSRFDGDSFDTYRFQSPLTGLSPSSIGVNTSLDVGDDTRLLGTTGGVVCFNTSKGRAELCPYLHGKDVRSLEFLPDGSLIAATSSGVYVCRDEAVMPVGGCSRQLSYQVVRQSAGRYWICSYSGLYSFDPSSGETAKIELPDNCPDGALSAAVDSARNCLWVGTGGALYALSFDSQKLTKVGGFEGSTVKVLLLDSKGTLWAGTESGLSAYSPEEKRIRTYRHDTKDDKSISNNVVWSLLESADGKIWAGTNRGVSVFDPENYRKVFRWRDLFGSQDVNNVGCILVDSDKTLWLGGDSGIGHYDGKTNPWYREESQAHHIGKNMVRDIVRLRDGSIWTATDGGVYIYDAATGSVSNRLFTDNSSSSFSNWCYGIDESATGNIYISTYESGIFETAPLLPDQGRIVKADKVYSTLDGSLPDNAVKSVAESADGSLWALMLKGGLVHMAEGHTETFRQLGGRHILPLSMLQSRDGNIWLSSTGGLVELSPKSGETVFHPVNAEETWPLFESGSAIWAMSSDKLISIKDGKSKVLLLDSSEYCCGAEYDEGTIVLAGGETIALIQADEADEEISPALYFTGARLNGETLDIGKEYGRGRVILDRDLDYVEAISLPWTLRNLELDIYSPSGIPLEYAMGDEWSALGKTPLTLYFPGLSQGEHTIVFRDSLSGKPIRALRITVLAPWYSRWYMIILYSVIVILLIVLASTLIVTRGHLKIETAQKEFYLRQAGENQRKLETLRRLSGTVESEATPEELLVQQLSAYVQQHLDSSDLSVQTLADQMRMPAKQLYRKVKAATGLTIVEFVRGLRLQKAAELLSSGRFNVSETMAMVGFSNLSYFTKCFMELYGVSPKHYAEK